MTLSSHTDINLQSICWIWPMCLLDTHHCFSSLPCQKPFHVVCLLNKSCKPESRGPYRVGILAPLFFSNKLDFISRKNPAVTSRVGLYLYLRTRAASLGLNLSFVPGCEDLWRSDISHHVEEVVAHEDSSLQQQEGEADAVPDDPGLVAGLVTFCWCKIHTTHSLTI